MAEVINFKKRKVIEAEKTAAARIEAIDILRGLCVMGMILVAYAGDWTHRFVVLNHADWHGLALADMIFPGFLLCVGAAIPLSFASRAAAQSKTQLAGHVLFRVVALFALGVGLNLLPHFDFAHVRIMGILQRIALCYGVTALLCLALGRKSETDFTLKIWPLALGALAVLTAYALLLVVSVPGEGAFDSRLALPAVVDRAVFTADHLWPYGTTDGVVTYDPEGLLSTIGAVFNVMLGAMVALQIRSKGLKPSLLLLGFCALVLFVAGAGLDRQVPIIKKLWTPSFALLSGGFTLLLFVVLAVIADVVKWRRWAVPAKVFGANAVLAFIGISLLDAVAGLPLMAGQSVHGAAAAALGSVIAEARLASLAYSVILLLILLAVLWPLYSKKIFLKL